MAILKLSAAAVNAELDALAALFDVGGIATINFYTGAQPASVASVATGTLIATSTMSAQAFQAAASGVSTANPIANSSLAVVGGPYILGYIRVTDAAGNAILDADVGVGAGFTVNIANTTTINSGESITVQSFTLSQAGI